MEVKPKYLVLLVIALALLFAAERLLPRPIFLALFLFVFVTFSKIKRKYVFVDERDELVAMKSCRAALLVAVGALTLIATDPAARDLSPLALLAVFLAYYGAMAFYYKKYG